jgi:uncharacterized protein YndB with AHSA1/START domain
MLKFLAIFALVLVAAIAGVVVLASQRPDTFRIERTTVINAPPEKIFPLINDMRSWSAWSPYEKKDPDMKRTFSGAAMGKGSVYEYEGDKNIGKGRLEITESTPPSKVVIDLKFLEPFKANHTAELTLEPQDDGTKVTWAMYGPAPLMAKVMHMFFNMEKMVGDDFAAGLANLKALAEKS